MYWASPLLQPSVPVGPATRASENKGPDTMTVPSRGRRAGLSACAAAAFLLLSGCNGPDPSVPATTPPPAVSAAPVPGPADPPPASVPPAPSVLPRSAPVSLSIPAAGISSPLMQLGLRENGTLEVPPEPPGSPAGWYTESPAPGEQGPAVMLGHVNATGGGPGVFADLRALKPGDRVEVAREDGTTAAFTVDRGEQYGKNDFPTLEVYGNTAGAELRLITCDGYDPETGEFEDNYVVYASLTP